MEPLLAGRDEYFIGCDVSPCVFEMYWRLRGMERRMLDMAAEPELTYEMLGRCGRFRRRAVRGRLPAVSAGLAVDGRRRGQPAIADDEPRDLAAAHQAAPGAGHSTWARRTACGWLTIAAGRCGRSSPTWSKWAWTCSIRSSAIVPAWTPLELKREFGCSWRSWAESTRRGSAQRHGRRSAAGHAAADRRHDRRRRRIHPGRLAHHSAPKPPWRTSSPCTPRPA